ncbi:MAG: hypothetical protein ACMZ63_07615 [Methylotenera sp.]
MKLLKNVMVLNALSCIGFGLLFVISPSNVNAFVGNALSWLTPIVGIVLIFNGCHLLFASQRKKPVCPEILYFIAGDLAWVVSSIVLVILGVVVTSTFGIVVCLLVALMVGTFGFLQFIGYRSACLVKNA